MKFCLFLLNSQNSIKSTHKAPLIPLTNVQLITFPKSITYISQGPFRYKINLYQIYSSNPCNLFTKPKWIYLTKLIDLFTNLHQVYSPSSRVYSQIAKESTHKFQCSLLIHLHWLYSPNLIESTHWWVWLTQAWITFSNHWVSLCNQVAPVRLRWESGRDTKDFSKF